MRTPSLVVVIALGIAPPVLAQARLYTNSDLGKPLHRTHMATSDELQGLAAHQFTLPQNYDGPRVIVASYDPNWPFTYSRRLDPDPWRVPSGWPIGPYLGSYEFGACGAYAGPGLLWSVSRDAAAAVPALPLEAPQPIRARPEHP